MFQETFTSMATQAADSAQTTLDFGFEVKDCFPCYVYRTATINGKLIHIKMTIEELSYEE